MKKLLLLTAVLGTVAFANPYGKCVACHGANGEKVALGKSKVIKDMSKADFIASMKGYQDGSYGGPMKGVMIPQAKGLSDADLETIANKLGLK